MKKLRLSFDKESMKLHVAIDDYVDFYNPYTGNIKIIKGKENN